MKEKILRFLQEEYRRTSAVLILFGLTCIILSAAAVTEVWESPAPEPAVPKETSAAEAEQETAVEKEAAEEEKDSEPDPTLVWSKRPFGWMCLRADGSQIRSSWVYLGGKYYYLDDLGYMCADMFRLVGDYRYHFAADGALDIGRFYAGDTEYASDRNGVLYQDTWVPDGDRWYYCDENGTVLKDCMTPDSYYVGKDGYMAVTAAAQLEGFTYSNGGNRKLYLNLGTADIIWDYFIKKGWNEKAIAGVLGNFQQESGIDPSLEEAGNHIGYGLGQWSFERRTNLEAYAAARNVSPANLIMQLDFLCQEAGERNFVQAYAHTDWNSPAAAAIEWGLRWERYNLSDLSMSRVRIPYAEAYYAHYVYGVTYLVSGTLYREPEALAMEASAADADFLLDEAAIQDGLQDPLKDGAVEDDAAAEETVSSEYMTEGDRSSLHQQVEGSATVTKVKRVTEIISPASFGPGIGMQEASSDAAGAESGETEEAASGTAAADTAAETASPETAAAETAAEETSGITEVSETSETEASPEDTGAQQGS